MSEGRVYRDPYWTWEDAQRAAEFRRQQELVASLGQVECSSIYAHRSYERCPDCGAEV